MLKHPMVDLTGLVVIALLVFGGAYWLGTQTVPRSQASDYLVIAEDGVFVHNAKYGDDPAMEVDRTIMQDFSGDWVATIRPVGSMEFVCGNKGTAPYREDANFPANLRLFDFWLLAGEDPSIHCRPGFYPLPAGCYVVDTTWEFDDPQAFAKLQVHRRSNQFCVSLPTG